MSTSPDEALEEAKRRQHELATGAPNCMAVACPGAGKTGTIVRRLAHRTASLMPRKGIAVLSFTNAAVEEFRARCVRENIGHMLEFPGFASTIDHFLNHFLLLPSGIPGCDYKPDITPDWNDISVRIGTMAESRGQSVPLSHFHPVTGELRTSGLGSVKKYAQDNKEGLERRARATRAALHKKGWYSSEDARHEALRIITDARRGGAARAAIATRFHEVIIDEAQDCSEEDIKFFEWLSVAVPIVIICDPDQAIYEFRDSNPRVLLEFAARRKLRSLPMQSNFRSSQVICNAAATCRDSVRALPDVAVGRNSAFQHEVLILPFENVDATVGERFVAEVTRNGHELGRSIILAHSWRDARAAVGRPSKDTGGAGRLARLAALVVEFHGAVTSGPQRSRCVLEAIRFMMELEEKQLTSSVSQTLAGLPDAGHSYRRRAIKLLSELGAACSSEEEEQWAKHARTLVTTLLGANIRLPLSAGCLSALTSRSRGVPVAHSSVHEAKGREYDAVCMVLSPPRKAQGPDEHDAVEQLFAAWENRASHESLRVVYVGMTRAERMLALAVHDSLHSRLERILRNVPIRILGTRKPEQLSLL